MPTRRRDIINTPGYTIGLELLENCDPNGSDKHWQVRAVKLDSRGRVTGKINTGIDNAAARTPSPEFYFEVASTLIYFRPTSPTAHVSEASHILYLVRKLLQRITELNLEDWRTRSATAGTISCEQEGYLFTLAYRLNEANEIWELTLSKAFQRSGDPLRTYEVQNRRHPISEQTLLDLYEQLLVMRIPNIVARSLVIQFREVATPPK